MARDMHHLYTSTPGICRASMGCLDKELKLAGTAGFEYTLPGSAGTVPNGPIVGTVEIDFSLEQANPTNLQIHPRHPSPH